MTFEFSRKHLLLFGILLTMQVSGVLLMWGKEAGCKEILILLLASAPGSAFLSTLVITELVKAFKQKTKL